MRGGDQDLNDDDELEAQGLTGDTNPLYRKFEMYGEAPAQEGSNSNTRKNLLLFATLLCGLFIGYQTANLGVDGQRSTQPIGVSMPPSSSSGE
jgi:hypothetical protein